MKRVGAKLQYSTCAEDGTKRAHCVREMEKEAQQGSRLSFGVVGPASCQIFLLEIFGGCSRDDITRESIKFVRSQKITELKPRPNL